MGTTQDLNFEQREAAESGDGPLLIIAGPGTGKTKTLLSRITHLISTGRAKPSQILALTFTKKTAQEMLDRMVATADGDLPDIKTFHSLCFDILDNSEPFVKDAERLQIVRSLPKPKGLKDLSVRELGLKISLAKNSVRESDDPDLARIVRAYNKALAEQGVRDFDDLLTQAYRLLEGDSKVRQTIQDKYHYILVDEFQDTNRLQYEILKLLLGHDNLFVIGDPNQSIYGFRGASDGLFDQLRLDFPNLKEIDLTINYRSVPQVVRLSNVIFPEAHELSPNVEDGGLVRSVEVLNEYGEAAWVLNEIQKGIGGGDLLKAISDDVREHHRRLSDFAVLYRSRPAAVTFQKLLSESGLPYQVVGDGSPYDQPQIQAIISLMRSAIDREPVRLEGYGSAERRFLEESLSRADEAVPSVLVERIVDILGIEPSLEMQQFAGVLARFKDVRSALKYFDEIAESGFYDSSADVITLLTIHASKGLEFPCVFLIGAEEGILPSFRGEEAEDKRLFYVAATRPRERLEITHARNRGGQKAEPSRFITELPHDVLKRHTDPDIDNQVRRIAKRAAKNSQTSLF